jgi:uncharacterized membrane protein
MSDPAIWFYLVFLAVMVIIASSMAESRGRSRLVWSLLTFLFGVFALAALALMGKADGPP